MALAAVLSVTSCGKEELDPTSHIIDTVNEETEFDKWLEENYRSPYNIRFLYRYEDIQTSMSYNIAPAKEIYCRILAKLFRYLWIDVYSECGGTDFMRKNSPRMLQIVGSGAYNSNGTITVGFAEGGQKITLNVANWLESYGMLRIDYDEDGADNNGDGYVDYTVEILKPKTINNYFLHFAHHEYAHILHQTIDYPNEFKTISQGSYAASWTGVSYEKALKDGFVTTYSTAGASEDFVEVFATYITSSDEEWQEILTGAAADGAAGAERINKKLDIVKNYMKSSWGIDLDQMRSVVERRYGDISKLDWDNFKTGE